MFSQCCFDLAWNKLIRMKFTIAILIAIFYRSALAQNLATSCIMPEDIPASRLKRLHHPCESNQNRDLAIEAKRDFYCIFYSTFEISLFGAETLIEIKFDSDFEHDQTGSTTFEIVNKTIILSASNEDVRVLIRKKNNILPTITSLIMLNGALPGAAERQEFCERNCGVQDTAVSNIIGGVEAREGAWPWNAAIYYKQTAANLQFRCGATIINKRTLITTATCLSTQGQAISPDKLQIAVKEMTIYGSASSRLSIEKVKLHENFRSDETDGNNLKYDFNVGIMITQKEIPFSLHVSPICLPLSDKFDFKGKHGVVVGWGYNSDYELSQRLHEIDVPTYPFLDCFFRNRVFFHGHAAKRNFCAGYEKDKGICSGDSGGGLYIKFDNRYFLYGLSSFSNCRCDPESKTCAIYDEGIFVNVADYLQWIHINMF